MDNEKFQELVLLQLAQLQKSIQSIESNTQKNTQSIDMVAQETMSLQNGLTEVKTSVVRMENELIDKVRVLFDANSLQMDYFESLKDGQARIEQQVSSISRRLLDYDYKIDTYERELRLIRAEKKPK
jgi:chromosome segregation ATPase